MKIILIAATLMVFLSSCTPQPTPAPTATATKQPTVTITPQPTATITPEPTQSPEQIADSLGLRSEPLYRDRGFEYKEINGTTYLVDGWNGAPKAVLTEDGKWRVLDYGNEQDVEVMYGHLVPAVGEYLFPGVIYQAGIGPIGRSISPVFLGDWEAEEVGYKGETINLYHLLAGLRDGDGGLHIVRLAYDSPDVQPAHGASFHCDDSHFRLTSESGIPHMVILEDLLPQLRVGEPLGIFIYERSVFPIPEFEPYPNGYPEVNNVQEMLMSELVNSLPGMQLTAPQKAAIDQRRWPEGVVTFGLPKGFAVRRASLDECPVRRP
jgi:hypothetical protein